MTKGVKNKKTCYTPGVHPELLLIPTPIADDGPLDPAAAQVLKGVLDLPSESRPLILVESASVSRRQFSAWGLPRGLFECLTELHEQNEAAEIEKIIGVLQKGRSAYILSDGGLPAFCDPGSELVDRAWDRGVSVRILPISNSLIAAVTLSGFCGRKGEFQFLGFPPANNQERLRFLTDLVRRSNPAPVFLMDTPYRLGAVLGDLADLAPESVEIFLAADLFSHREWCLRGTAKKVFETWGNRVIADAGEKKKEFVLGIRTRRRLSK